MFRNLHKFTWDKIMIAIGIMLAFAAIISPTLAFDNAVVFFFGASIFFIGLGGCESRTFQQSLMTHPIHGTGIATKYFHKVTAVTVFLYAVAGGLFIAGCVRLLNIS